MAVRSKSNEFLKHVLDNREVDIFRINRYGKTALDLCKSLGNQEGCMLIQAHQKKCKKARVPEDFEKLLAKFPIKSDDECKVDSLEIEIITPGKGPNCQVGSKARLHLSAFLADGTFFDSTYQRMEPYTFDYVGNPCFKAWNRALS